MYKIAGTVKYPYGAVSASDNTGTGLGYPTREAAQQHADIMNKLLEAYPEKWNIEVWVSKPDRWVVFETENL